MHTAILLLSGCYVAGCFAMVYGFMTAPMAEESDEHGFQITWCNDSPEARDVSCIWTILGAENSLDLA